MFYYEKLLNKKINVKFKLIDLNTHYDKYDLIWVNEAISHIHPVDKFLKISKNNLVKGGKLIISDGNNLNPYTYLEGKKKRIKYGKFTKRLDPNTGKNIIVANENYFSILSIKKLLSEYFKIKEITLIGFLPYLLFNIFKNFSIRIERNLLSRIPLIKLFACIYIIVCTKNN